MYFVHAYGDEEVDRCESIAELKQSILEALNRGEDTEFITVIEGKEIPFTVEPPSKTQIRLKCITYT